MKLEISECSSHMSVPCRLTVESKSKISKRRRKMQKSFTVKMVQQRRILGKILLSLMFLMLKLDEINISRYLWGGGGSRNWELDWEEESVSVA